MGAFAQLPVNKNTLDSIEEKLFQWAPLPNSLSTTTPCKTNRDCVSMGAFAQLPVNLRANAQHAPIACFNGRLCPTPCQQILILEV